MDQFEQYENLEPPKYCEPSRKITDLYMAKLQHVQSRFEKERNLELTRHRDAMNVIDKQQERAVCEMDEQMLNALRQSDQVHNSWTKWFVFW